MANDSVFAATADPTRRKILELVAAGPASVAQLTRAFPISQSAVSQHLKVLRDARLVKSEARGASNIYSIDPAGLGEIRKWLDRMWERALDEFKQAVESEK